MKRVLIIMPQLWTGGIQKMNLEIVSHINDPRVEVRILSLYPKCGSIFEKQAEERGIKVIYLDKKPGFDISVIPKISKVFREYKPDVIHINQRMTTYVILPALFNGIRKKYYVVHSMADNDAKGIPRFVNMIAFHLLGVVPVAISDICRRSIADVYKLKEDRIELIYNGVDTKRFTRKTPYFQLPDEPVEFITVCAFREEKNLPLLIDTFARVHRRNPKTHLTIVGDGEIMPKLKTMIEKNGIGDCVNLPGATNEVPAYMDQANIFVLSSTIEGLPVSILEAMSMELPVISTNVGGVSDIVNDFENGILVPPCDGEHLMCAMLNLAADKDLRRAFSEKSKELSKKYTMDECARNYVDLYLK